MSNNTEETVTFEDGSVANLKDELKAIDDYIAEKEFQVKLGEYLSELENNEAFNVIFYEQYVMKESERLMQAMTNPSIYKKEVIDNMSSMMSGIRHFKQFLINMDADAKQAVAEIEDNKQRRKEVTELAAAQNANGN